MRAIVSHTRRRRASKPHDTDADGERHVRTNELRRLGRKKKNEVRRKQGEDGDSSEHARGT